ncbi:trypsin-1-like isoform X2 [Panonychus citri]|uniref:trypsin-1-like isoform X2 n=1 Tax=Panonychus citri TaxID=50023 RepID=UPI0023077D47|nr:trypsin-1-like isoform X2 [Panonychus citri]
MNKVIIMLIIITRIPFDSGLMECGLRQSARAKANRRTARETISTTTTTTTQSTVNSVTTNQLNSSMVDWARDSDPEMEIEINNAHEINGQQHLAAIVGGSFAVPGDFCWQCSLTLNGRQHCGATIINDRYVLTAAHCLVIPGKRAVKVGGLFWYSGVTYPVTRIIVHPGYSSNSMKNDIGLAELSEPIKFTNGARNGNGAICPVCLPDQDQEFSGTLVASGWGAIREGGSKSDKMKWVQLSWLRSNICTDAYPHYKANTQICAGFITGGRDTCQGDSGGPLVKFAKMKPDEKEKRAFLVGIVSNGNGCARPGYPGIYTKVSSYLSWIQSHMTRR